ncbi:hypothetical protein BJV74DRAFT_888375 [Russula compacta]|nr:hypothetical protein BJV74DRAFT_888375 [Russula compacta]
MSRHPLTRTYAVADLSQGQPPMPVSRPQPKKRGWPPKATTTTVSSTIASDKDKQEPSAGNGDSSGNEEQPPAKKPKASNNKGATSSMPLDKKNKRHTSAQVAADKKRKEELQRDLDALAQRQIEILAEMEAKQEMADEAEDQDAIRTLADIDEIKGDVEMLDAISEFSEFGGDTDVDREAGCHGGLLGRLRLLIFLPYTYIFPTVQLESSPLPPPYLTPPLLHSCRSLLLLCCLGLLLNYLH